MTTWRRRIRLWSAVLVCAILMPIAFTGYLIATELRRLWRDIIHLRMRNVMRGP